MKIKRLLMIALALLSLTAISVFAISCGATGTTSGSDGSVESEQESQSKVEEPVAEATVVFDTNTDFVTNVVRERVVVIGRRTSQPKVFITGENPDNLNVYGWYTSPNCEEETKWDFKNDRVTEDVTLYAKWVELYDVHYYLNGTKSSTINVFNGDKVAENAELVAGYKYLGSFADAEHSTLFDFDAPITGETNIYVKHSEGLYLSDYEEEGLLSSGGLTDYLTSGCGSFNPDVGTEEGWVEKYTIEATGEKCTYVNLGLNPVVGDGYFELSLALDISKSQIIRLTFKNLGPATVLSCFFTAMLDIEGKYSETGSLYTEHYKWPNYIGSTVTQSLTIPCNMEETDDWVTVDLNLYEICKNGYSIWGTSPYLGSMRIDLNYKNVGPDDWSNEILIKSIEGVPYDIEVEDSDEIKELLANAMNTTEDDMLDAADRLPENEMGIDFVKDYQGVVEVDGAAEVYPTVYGMLLYAENEILARETEGASKGFTIKVPEGREINLDEFTTMKLTLRNYGYAKNLIIYVYNDEGVPVRTSLDISARMLEAKTYNLNLFGLFGMNGNLSKIEFVYTSVGVDNVILFEDVTFADFMPFDVVGINFNDKFAFGMESTADVAIKYDLKARGTEFDVSRSGAVLTSPDKPYDATNVGYEYMSLKYKLDEGSNITAVKVELKVNGEFGTPYLYELTEFGSAEVKLPLVKEERGFVKAVRLTFEGTGKIIINELAYSVGETGLPFYHSYNVVYGAFPEWKGIENTYEYDNKLMTSTFTKGPASSTVGFAIYIGYSANVTHLNAPHTTKSVKVTGRTVVTLVYQNRTSASVMDMQLTFDINDHLPGDGSPYNVFSRYNLPIDSEMEEYEWSAVSIVLEGDNLQEYLGAYLAKVNVSMPGDQITIRVISIEVEE